MTRRSRRARSALGAPAPRAARVGLFYRLTDDIVYLQTSQFFAQYRNLLEARSAGIEATASWRPLTPIQIAAGLTWQDIRNRSPRGASAEVADRYHGARLPNIPYLFGNAQLTLEGADLVAVGSRATLWWSTQWVHEFFLHWEVDGRRDSKAVIPEQLLHGLGAAWSLYDGRLQIIGEVCNLFNARAFDVWLVGGGSGHGYKHGIMLGDYVARRVTGQTTDFEMDEFFALKDATF